MVFGVQKVVHVQESYTIWQKSMFVYSLNCSVCRHSMDLIGEVNV